MSPYLMDIQNSCIILFAKAPIPGHVKTRLAKEIGETAAVGLYRNFTQDIIEKTTAAGHEVKLFYDPPGSEPLMQAWLGNRHEYVLQTGADLGQKMANAFKHSFGNGIKRLVLMGTDFPDLPEKIISDALVGLKTNDAVIGPTIDGGYYLIGFSADAFQPAVFQDMPWGTADVYQKTLNIFSSFQTKLLQLPKWRDIDAYDDLLDLIRCLKKHPEKAKNTYSFLNDINMI